MPDMSKKENQKPDIQSAGGPDEPTPKPKPVKAHDLPRATVYKKPLDNSRPDYQCCIRMAYGCILRRRNVAMDVGRIPPGRNSRTNDRNRFGNFSNDTSRYGSNPRADFRHRGIRDPKQKITVSLRRKSQSDLAAGGLPLPAFYYT